jgi:single-strand DNA-binding protein
MVNEVTLIGHLGKDPEVKSFSNGGTLTTCSMATTESYKDKEGNWQDATEWHNLRFTSANGERATRQLYKGALVRVRGKITYRSYQNQDGHNVNVTEILVLSYINLDKKNGKPEAQAQRHENAAPAPAESGSADNGNSDLPF